MADEEDYSGVYYGTGNGEAQQADDGVSFGDYLKTGVSGVLSGALAPVAAGARALTNDSDNETASSINKMSKVLQGYLNTEADNINSSRSESAKRRAEAAVTSKDFWDHPLSATMLKATGMAGPMAAMVFSGGPIGAAIVGGALNAGSYLNDLDKVLDAAPDAKLQENEWYASLRSMGMSEADARDDLKQKLFDNKILLNFATGAIGGAFGPAGKLAAGVSGKAAVGMAGAEAGALRRGVAGTIEGAAAGALEGGASASTLQQSEQEVGLRKGFDGEALVNAVLEGGLMGGVLGGAAGALVKSKGKTKETTDVVEPPADQGTQEQGRGVENPVVEPATAPAAQEANVGGPTAPDPVAQAEAVKPPKKKGAKPLAEATVLPDALSPDLAQAVALKPDTITAPEVLAAKDDTGPGFAQPKVVPEVTSEVIPAPETPAEKSVVPPEFQQSEPVSAPGVETPVSPQADIAPVSAPKRVKKGKAKALEIAAKTAEGTPAEPRAPKILNSETAESVANQKATLAKQQADEKAALAVAKEASKKKLSADEKVSIEQRGAHAKEVFDARDLVTLRELPVTPKARAEMSAEIDKILATAAAKGLVPRESLPNSIKNYFSPPKGKPKSPSVTPDERHAYHTSIPEQVGHADMSPHVRYLRELIGVKKALASKKFGPASEARARVAQFLTEHTTGDLESQAARRKDDGARASVKNQGDVEAPTGKVAEAVAGADHTNEHTKSAEEHVLAKEAIEDNTAKTPEEFAAELAATKSRGEVVGPDKATLAELKLDKEVAAREARAAEKAAAPKLDPKAGIDKLRFRQKRNIDAAGIIAEAKEKAKAAADAKRTETAKRAAAAKELKAVNKAKRLAEKNRAKAKAEADAAEVAEADAAAKARTAETTKKAVDPKIEEIRLAAKAKVDAEAAPAEAAPVKTVAVDKSAYSTTLTPEELAAFKKKKAEKAEAAARFIEDQKLYDEAAEWSRKASDPTVAALGDHTKLVDATTRREVKPLHSMSAAKALDALDLSHLAGVPKALAEFAKRRFKAMVGDTPVHVLDNEGMAAATGDLQTAFIDNADKGTKGFFKLDKAGRGGVIALRSDQFSDPRKTAHVVLHEVTHAATLRAILENKGIHDNITNVMQEVKDALVHLPPEASKAMRYAMLDTREFIAEAFSNPAVQEILQQIPASRYLVGRLALDHGQRLSVWDAMVAVVRKAVETITGRLPEGHNMVDAVMRLGKMIDYENVRRRSDGEVTPLKMHLRAAEEFTTRPDQDISLPGRVHLKAFDTQEVKDYAADFVTNSKGRTARIKDALSSTFMLKERAEQFFGPSNPFNRIFDLRAKQEWRKDAILKEDGGAEVVNRTAELQRQHPEAMSKGAELLRDAGVQNVNLGPGADNTHLGKNATKGFQAKKRLPELQRRYDELAREAPEVAQHLQDVVNFTRDVHNKVSMTLIENTLDAANIKQAGLAERIFKDGVTEADRELYENTVVSALAKATGLKELKGWYLPHRRYGDFISSAEHEIAVPKGAIKINDNTIQFGGGKTKIGRLRAAKAFVEQDSHTPQGNHLKDAAIQKVFVKNNDATKLTDPTDIDGVVAYRVRMQTQHTEFHDTLAEAQRSQKDLDAAGLQNVSTHKREDAHRASPGLEGSLSTVMRSLENNEKFKAMEPAQRAAVKQALLNASISAMSSTNIKTSMAHRRNVAGMSTDMGRVLADYARMTANYRAQLEYRPQIDKAFGEAREYMKGRTNDQHSIRRDELYAEFQSRIYGDGDMLAKREPNPAIRKLLQVSRLARLAGVSFHVINSQEPWTTSLPMIGGRHGFVQTSRTMANIYSAIGARGGVLAGLKDTAGAFRNDNGFTDHVKMFKSNIAKSNTMGGSKSARFAAMIDYMVERNLYGSDTIFEVGKTADPTSNVAFRALDRADLMANQVGSAIEAINRTVTGLSAYDLEFKKNGGNHEAAMHYAYTMAHKTMGDYSAWNAAPLFNTRGGQLALQFKKFGHKTYYMLGETIGRAAHGDKEAIKQFAGLMVTHGLVAGVLGLPTEPFKVALMAANAVGITGFTPEDYDRSVRELAARVAGAKGGEIISRGLYRGIGIEVSGRMGQDSLMTFGTPHSAKTNDLKAWLFDTMAGAPAGYILDQITAAQALAKGDIATAITKASPIRAVGDVAKAVTGAMGPKLSPTGREQREALGPWETAVRAVGFTPSGVAEDGAMRGAISSNSKKLSAARGELITGWLNGSDKAAVWRSIVKWNEGKPKDVQIKMSDLTKAKTRKATEEEGGKVKHGIKIGKMNKEISDRAFSTYNP